MPRGVIEFNSSSASPSKAAWARRAVGRFAGLNDDRMLPELFTIGIVVARFLVCDFEVALARADTFFTVFFEDFFDAGLDFFAALRALFLGAMRGSVARGKRNRHTAENVRRRTQSLLWMGQTLPQITARRRTTFWGRYGRMLS